MKGKRPVLKMPKRKPCFSNWGKCGFDKALKCKDKLECLTTFNKKREADPFSGM